MSTKKPSGWWNAAAFHQPLLSLSPTKNVNYTRINGKSKLILAEAVHFRRRGRWYYQNTDGREIPAKLRPADKENCSNGREHMSIVPRKSRSRSGPTG